MRIERLEAAYDIEVVYRHFPLHPETPDAGLTLEELFAGRNLDVPRMQSEMAEREGGARMHDDLFRAYFVDDGNLADIDNLVGLVARAGLDATDARVALEERRFREQVDADWARSAELGITGVPTFVAGIRGLAGAQPYEAIERLVGEAGAVQRTS